MNELNANIIEFGTADLAINYGIMLIITTTKYTGFIALKIFLPFRTMRIRNHNLAFSEQNK